MPSALPPKATDARTFRIGSFVPTGDIGSTIIQLSHHAPNASDSSVSGTPARQ
jgi:hypothetical protein